MTRRLTRSVHVAADEDTVFALLADIADYADWFHGITRWEPVDEQPPAVGARFRVLMQVGSIQAGGTIGIDVWDPPCVIAWSWRTGTHHEGRWEVRPEPSGSRLTLTLSFALAGPFAWPVERLAGRIVGRHLEATLLAARRRLEHGGT